MKTLNGIWLPKVTPAMTGLPPGYRLFGKATRVEADIRAVERRCSARIMTLRCGISTLLGLVIESDDR
jgi:hypothetical protein